MMKRWLLAALLLLGALALPSGHAAVIPQQVMNLTTGAVWNSSTALNATQTIYSGNGSQGPNEVIVQTDTTTTISTGAVTFEATFDGTNWVAVAASQVLDPTSATLAQISIPYTLVANTNKTFAVLTNGAQGIRIKLSTAITGTGTLTPYFAVQPAATGLRQIIVLSPTAANFNVTSNLASGSNTVGKVDILGNAGATLDGTAGSPATGVLSVQGVSSGTAVPVSGTVTSQVSSNNAAATPHVCSKTAFATNITSATDTQLVAGTSSQVIYVCGYAISVGGTATNAYLEEASTGTCATLTQIDMIWYLPANGQGGYILPSAEGLVTAASDQLCVHTSAAGPTDVTVYYDKY